MKDVWDFVEKYYPNYYNCAYIADVDDIDCILDNQIEPGSSAEKFWNRIMKDNNIINKTQYLIDIKNELLQHIYSTSVKEYINETFNKNS